MFSRHAEVVASAGARPPEAVRRVKDPADTLNPVPVGMPRGFYETKLSVRVSSTQIKELTYTSDLPAFDDGLYKLPKEYNNQHALSFVNKIMETYKGDA